MNGESSPTNGVDLAHEPDFDLGTVKARPSLCRVEFDGRSEHLEPRVMQVLTALNAARGETVTREALTERCWGGRIVGEDAINRSLGRVRALARASGGAFSIETVPRVGWRLTVGSRPGMAGGRWRRFSTGPARWAMAAAVTASALAIAIALWWLNRPLHWRVDSVEILSGAPGWERRPDLSPDGRFVVYSAPPLENPEGDNGDIYMRAVAGGDPARLVASPDHDNAPAFSPEGDRIAFIRTGSNFEETQRPPRGRCRLIVKPLPEGAERVVGRCPHFPGAGTLDWTADGTGLIFTDVHPIFSGRILRLDIATGALRLLTHPPPGARDFSGVDSPNGRQLAFTRYTSEGSSDLWVLDLVTRELNRVTAVDAYIASPDWAPDGQGLIFAGELDGMSGLWWVSASGDQPPRRLLLGLRALNRVSVAHDRIAFETFATTSRLLRRGADGESELAEIPGPLGGLDVSATGDLAFIAGDEELWLAKSGQAVRRHMRLDQVLPREISWSPDGRRLGYIADENGQAYLYVLSLDSGRLRRLRAPTKDLRGLAWIEDGRALVVAGRNASGWRLWRVGRERGARARPSHHALRLRPSLCDSRRHPLRHARQAARVGRLAHSPRRAACAGRARRPAGLVADRARPAVPTGRSGRPMAAALGRRRADPVPC